MAPMTPEKRIAQAARKAASAYERLEIEIREGRDLGLPLRTIATASGLSHETVRRIASR